MDIDRIQEIAREVMSGTDPRPESVQQCVHQDAFRYPWLLYRVAQELKPKVYVELGIYAGRCCASVAAASPDTQVIGIDYKPELCDPQVSALPNVEIIEADTAQYEWTRGEINMMLFDSTHTYAQLHTELEKWYPHCAPGAVLFFDDIGPSYAGATERAWRKEVTEPKAFIPGVHGSGNGFGVHIKC